MDIGTNKPEVTGSHETGMADPPKAEATDPPATDTEPPKPEATEPPVGDQLKDLLTVLETIANPMSEEKKEEAPSDPTIANALAMANAAKDIHAKIQNELTICTESLESANKKLKTCVNPDEQAALQVEVEKHLEKIKKLSVLGVNEDTNTENLENIVRNYCLSEENREEIPGRGPLSANFFANFYKKVQDHAQTGNLAGLIKYLGEVKGFGSTLQPLTGDKAAAADTTFKNVVYKSLLDQIYRKVGLEPAEISNRNDYDRELNAVLTRIDAISCLEEEEDEEEEEEEEKEEEDENMNPNKPLMTLEDLRKKGDKMDKILKSMDPYYEVPTYFVWKLFVKITKIVNKYGSNTSNPPDEAIQVVNKFIKSLMGYDNYFDTTCDTDSFMTELNDTPYVNYYLDPVNAAETISQSLGNISYDTEALSAFFTQMATVLSNPDIQNMIISAAMSGGSNNLLQALNMVVYPTVLDRFSYHPRYSSYLI